MKTGFFIFFSFALAIARCSSQPSDSDRYADLESGISETEEFGDIQTSVWETEAAKMTEAVTVTPSPTLTPTFAPSNTPTETQISLSDQEKQDILQAYKLTVLVQLNTELLHDTLDRTQKGELDGFEQMGILLVLGALFEAIDEAFAEIDPPDVFEAWWDDIISIHNRTREITAAWVDQEILSGEAIDRLLPIRDEINTIIIDIENALSIVYHFNPDELTQQRQQIIDSTEELFEDTGQ